MLHIFLCKTTEVAWFSFHTEYFDKTLADNASVTCPQSFYEQGKQTIYMYYYYHISVVDVFLDENYIMKMILICVYTMRSLSSHWYFYHYEQKCVLFIRRSTSASQKFGHTMELVSRYSVA